MNEEKKYYVLAFYLFTPIENPQEEVRKQKEFFAGRDITSRIYISEAGINAQMSASEEDALAYMEMMRKDPRFRDIDFKIHFHSEQVFPRATVKYRKQLVALDHDADPHKGGEHVSPAEWKRMLETEKEVLLLDVRNDYEWKIGRFKGAVKPALDMFRKFPAYVKELREQYDPAKTKVMMYCTGGIRCELYSTLMKEEGFENVYQLNGGVIRYGLEQGEDLWEGKLFVFDDRMAVPIAREGKGEPIAKCSFCGTPSDVYYNCANMDCNELFLSCPSCAEQFSGCCGSECKEAPRVRTFASGVTPKPFRRKHLCGCE